MARRWLHAWGEATAFLRGSRRPTLADLVVVGALGGLAFAVARVAHGWAGELRPAVEIDLSPRALPGYALLSLSRGLVAYLFSFLFTLGYGSWAAHDRRAERVLVPLLDVLQSVPVLGFMPGLVLALVALFPRSSAGLELAAILMIFTGQAWNINIYAARGEDDICPGGNFKLGSQLCHGDGEKLFPGWHGFDRAKLGAVIADHHVKAQPICQVSYRFADMPAANQQQSWFG